MVPIYIYIYIYIYKLPTVPIKKNTSIKNFKKKLLTSHKIKKTLFSEQLLTLHKIISLQMINAHYTPKFFCD